MDIKAYFKNYVNNIAYLEIDKDYYIKGVNLKGLPLPVRVQDLVDNLKNEKLTENVNFEIFSIGMLYNIGIDEDFKHNREYIKILSKIYENILKLIFNTIFQLKEDKSETKKTNEDVLILYHAAYIIKPDDELAIYGYGTELLNHYKLTKNKEEKNIFFKELKNIIENSLKTNLNSPYIYILYGNLNIEENMYIKAMSCFKKALEFSEKEELKEKIRALITDIDFEFNIEKAVQYLNNFNFDKARKILIKINNNNTLAIYYMGLSYLLEKNYDEALIYYERLYLKYSERFLELFIDLSICYFMVGRIKDGFSIIQEGLEQYNDNTSLLYNRIMMNYQLNNLKDALKDIEILIQYDDIDNEIFNQLCILKENILKK